MVATLPTARRWPSRRQATWLPAILLLAGLVLTFRSTLFQGRTLAALPGLTGLAPAPPGTPPPPVLDISSAYIDEPLARLAASQLAAGRLPHWNPHNGLGQPLLGNLQSALLSPLRWPQLLSSSPLVWDLTLLGRIALAGILALLLARALGLGPLGAGAAGTAFALNGYFLLHVNMHHLSVEVLLPGLLLALRWWWDRPGPWRGLFLGLLVWGSWVGGNPEATFFSALAAACMLGVLARQGPQPGRRLGAVLLWVLAGTLAAGPWLLPGLEHLRQGAHHHGGATGADSFRPWTLLGLFAPWYYRVGGGTGLSSFAPPWLGAATAVLALAGLAERHPADRIPTRTLGLLAGLLLLKAFGAPGLDLPGRIPPLSLLLFHKYALPLLALVLALLAGRGVEAWAGRRLAPWTLPAMAGLALLLGGGLHLWNLARAAGTPGLASVAFSPWPGLLSLAAVAGGSLLGRRPAAGLWLALVIVLEPVLTAPQERPPRRNPFAPPAYARALSEARSRGEPTRTVSLGDWVLHPDRPERLLPGTAGVLSPNCGAALGLDDLRINDAIVVGRFAALAEAAVDGRMQGGILEPGLFPPFLKEQLQQAEFFVDKWFYRDAWRRAGERERDRVSAEFALGNEAMDALGVTHLLLREEPAVRGRRAAADPGRWLDLGCFDGVTIYRNLKSPGRAFLPRQVHGAAGPGGALAWVSTHRDRLLQEAVVEDAPAGWLGRQASSPEDRIASRLARSGQLEVEISLSRPRVVVVAEAWYPGRQVLAGGLALPARPAQVGLTAVLAPAGRHLLTVEIVPRSFRLGCLAAAGGVALALALAFTSRRRPGR